MNKINQSLLKWMRLQENINKEIVNLILENEEKAAEQRVVVKMLKNSLKK